MAMIEIDEQKLHDLIVSTLRKYRQAMGDYWSWEFAVAESDFIDVADDVCEAARPVVTKMIVRTIELQECEESEDEGAV